MMPIGDYKICVEEANAFLKVAEYCDECDVSEFVFGMEYVYVVNAAIACELFIKAIMIKNSDNNTFSKGHNLYDLYNELPNEDKSKIKTIYNKYCQIDFDENLSEISKSFVDWRYAMEKKVSINLTGLLAFARALKEAADN